LCPNECDEFLDRIELFLDRELPSGECLDIESHLGGCSPCMKHYEFRRRLQAIIATRCGRERVPDTLIRRVRAIVVYGEVPPPTA
jgi:mycothiol system anti-sigma-R factor